MAKYICDFDEVTNIANQINDLANQMTKKSDEYLTTMDEYLTGWNGEAKENFANSNTEQISKIKANVSILNQSSEYLKEVVSRIQSAEEELSSLSI